MIEILKDENENLLAVCEYYIVDNSGKLKDSGNYIWISDIFVNKSQRNNGILKKFIHIICNRVPWSQFGYFWRKEKYPNRSPHIYSRNQWLKMSGG